MQLQRNQDLSTIFALLGNNWPLYDPRTQKIRGENLDLNLYLNCRAFFSVSKNASKASGFTVQGGGGNDEISQDRWNLHFFKRQNYNSSIGISVIGTWQKLLPDYGAISPRFPKAALFLSSNNWDILAAICR